MEQWEEDLTLSRNEARNKKKNNENKEKKPKIDLKNETVINDTNNFNENVDNSVSGNFSKKQNEDSLSNSSPKKKKKWSWKKSILSAIIILILFIISWFVLLMLNFGSTQVKTDKFDSKNIGTNSAITLVLGVDGLNESDLNNPESKKQLDDRRGIRADSIMLLATNPKKSEVKTVSVYRDLLITDACTNQQDKLNSTFANGWLSETSKDKNRKIESGANCMKKTLENYFNFKINNFVVINFSGFQQIIDSVGGVDIDVIGGRTKGTKFCEQDKFSTNGNPDESSWDQGKYCFVIGEKRHLNGEEALAYARHRHSDDDRWRTKRQSQVMAAIIKATKSPVNIAMLPFKTFGINSAFTTNIGGMDVATYLSTHIFSISNMKTDHIDLPYYDNMINGTYYLGIPEDKRQNAEDEIKEFIK